MKFEFKYKAISFDWDGVITVRGEILKQLAWDNLAKREGPAFIVALKNWRGEFGGGKGSRYDILRETFKELGEPAQNIEEKVKKYSDKYQHEVMDLMLADIRPNVVDILEYLSDKANLYINSATAEDGLMHQVNELGFAKYFKKVYGYPVDGSHRSKAHVLNIIMKEEGVHKPQEIIHIGDSRSDLEGVREVGIDFIAVSNVDNKWTEKDVVGYKLIYDLAELKNLL